MGVKRETIRVYNMTCPSCENRINRALGKLDGVISSKVSYSKSIVEIEYDQEKCNLSDIKGSIEGAGYSTKPSGGNIFVGFIFVILALLLLTALSLNYDVSRLLDNATYLMLFIVGLISSLHCIGMCGGIMLTQSILREKPESKLASIKPALSYNAGRVVSYTLLGGLIGALGSVLTLTLELKAGMQIFAGLFMIFMGLNMAGLTWFRKIHISLPWTAHSLGKKANTPFFVGLLNGLMPCGPLQTMQLFALGTGSMLKGALSLFFFSLGTVPLMLTFGLISGLLSKGFTRNILKFSGIIVMMLGVIMGSRGAVLAGFNFPSINSVTEYLFSDSTGDSENGNINKVLIKDNLQTLNMTVNSKGYEPSTFTVQKDIPVKWIIFGKKLDSCNNSVVVPILKIDRILNKGENIIEFTPKAVGDIPFSCSMGTYRGLIKVVDAPKPEVAKNKPLTNTKSSETNKTKDSPVPSIFGNDLKQLPPERIIRLASITIGVQRASVRGIGNEFDPLIFLYSKGTSAKLRIDLSQFDNPYGTFLFVEGKTGKTIKSFTGKNGIIELDIPTSKTSAYGIFQNEQLLSVVEITENLNKVNLKTIKDKYIK